MYTARVKPESEKGETETQPQALKTQNAITQTWVLVFKYLDIPTAPQRISVPSITQAEIDYARAAQFPQVAQGQTCVQRHGVETTFLSEKSTFGFVALKDHET